ncbi:MAG: hypothetical protein HZA50_10465 [Planctomycetes bacterium]|nr:hypothetical protein [Planctomycetota bacterium]
MTYCTWKSNWRETRQHFIDWWNHKGLLVGHWEIKSDTVRENSRDPGPMDDVTQRWMSAKWRPLKEHHQLATHLFPLDCLPISEMDFGPGTLATFIGSEPAFGQETVWYEPCIKDPDAHGPLLFDLANKWWRQTLAILEEAVCLAGDRYLVGCPDLIENIDILASLRGTEQVLMDMIERPEWVEQKIREINVVFFEAYQRIYEIIRNPDGGSSWIAFKLWGPGKTAKVQCDASAMFSPEMFRRFVRPALEEQCDWLDYSIFHLDGHQCICHLDELLSIESLGAIEWTPDPQVPESGGSPHWYDMYRRILKAGKSVQAIRVRYDEVIPLLDAVGPKGMYILADVKTIEQAENLAARLEPYRKQCRQ